MPPSLYVSSILIEMRTLASSFEILVQTVLFSLYAVHRVWTFSSSEWHSFCFICFALLIFSIAVLQPYLQACTLTGRFSALQVSRFFALLLSVNLQFVLGKMWQYLNLPKALYQNCCFLICWWLYASNIAYIITKTIICLLRHSD